MELNKVINKSIKYLKKFTSKKTKRNFIDCFLLYAQLKYNLNFKISNKNYNIKPNLYDCMIFLYSDLKDEELKSELFEDNEILYEIFKLKSKDKTSQLLKKIIDKVYSINYVNLNIEILDYLGNVSSDISIINYAYGVIWLKEINPNLKIPKKFTKIITEYLIEIAEKNSDKLRYSNTEAVLILFLLNRILDFKNLEQWIDNLCKQQKTDGRWTNGYNSYFINDVKLYDSYHTIVSLLVLLEYETLNIYKSLDNKPTPEINNQPIFTPIETQEKINKYNEEIPNIIETFENENTNFFKFEKILKINDKYTIHYNIYNICFFIFIILSFSYLTKKDF